MRPASAKSGKQFKQTRQIIFGVVCKSNPDAHRVNKAMMPGKTRQEDLAYMVLYKEGGVMAARLTDKQKKKIIADYVECGSYNAVAKKHGVSFDTVKRVVLRDKETVKKAEQKKEQNTADILSHMESQKDDVIKVLDEYITAMRDPVKIKRAGVVQLATALGIIIDKYTVTAKNEQALQKLDEVMDKIGGVI